MQVIANLASNNIVQTEAELSAGDSRVRNGHYVLQIPEGVSVTVDPNSYLLPQDSGSVPVQAAGELLVRFPMYDHVIFNFFLEDSDIAVLDLTSTAPMPTVANSTPAPPWASVPGDYPRCQVGRSAAGPLGVAPNSVAVLSINNGAGTARHGTLITDGQDLTPFNPGNPGTDDVAVWWEIGRWSTTEDVVTGYNTTSGQEGPALRQLQKTDPEPSDLFVYVSVDDGVTWFQANYMEPLDLVTPDTDLRVAFVNTGSTKYYILGYAILFQDLP